MTNVSVIFQVIQSGILNDLNEEEKKLQEVRIVAQILNSLMLYGDSCAMCVDWASCSPEMVQVLVKTKYQQIFCMN